MIKYIDLKLNKLQYWCFDNGFDDIGNWLDDFRSFLRG